ncbi:MAG TPA: aspartate/glutamate racemase family protein, partial [Synergistales bacterium]|nr:aspartate/glutamate racemase family protein [Synergistales bacterium]
DMPVVVYGMEDQDEFRTSILDEKGTLDSDLIEKEVCGVASRMKEENPNLGAVLLECSDLPPYAAAIQKVTDLPVFDFITMINHVHSAVCRTRYSGFM